MGDEGGEFSSSESADSVARTVSDSRRLLCMAGDCLLSRDRFRDDGEGLLPFTSRDGDKLDEYEDDSPELDVGDDRIDMSVGGERSGFGGGLLAANSGAM